MADQSEVVLCHGVQSRYWQEFIDLKRDALYVQFYHGMTEIIDRRLSGLSAIASSAAIAGWVIWRKSLTIFGIVVEFSFIWSIVIMASHLLTAVKDYLPYKKRLDSLSILSNDLASLAISMEENWFQVSHGLLTEEQIHRLHMEMKRHKEKIILKSFSNNSLPLNRGLRDRADLATQDYVKSFYGSNHG